MSEKTIITCDIDGCDNSNNTKRLNMDIIFKTEQTEGRGCKPYFDREELDLCPDCLSTILNYKIYITATGAMGYNTYTLKKGG